MKTNFKLFYNIVTYSYKNVNFRGYINHYIINIQPDKCPRRVNRDIIQTMVHAYSKIFGTQKPVFDGRTNLFVRDPLPIGK